MRQLFVLLLLGSVLPAAGDGLVEGGSTLEKVATGFETVEGPVYDGAGHLYFTDIPNGHIWKLDVKTLRKELYRENTGGANGLAFDRKGRLHMCKGKDRRLTRLEEDGEETTLLTPTRKGKDGKVFPVGVNDIVIDRRGGIYVTVPGAGAVMYLPPEGGEGRTIVSGLKGPNGLMLSPDEKSLYVSEYKLQRLHVYELETAKGTTTKGRVFAKVEEASAYGCDGMTVDDRGNLYCAGPHAVRIWNPAGELIDSIPVPESPTNCAFSGKGSHVLYITGRQSVFRIRMKSAGVR